MLSRTLLVAIIALFTASQAGCIVVSKDRHRSRSHTVSRDDHGNHRHCHPKKHGRKVCHSHPHRGGHH